MTDQPAIAGHSPIPPNHARVLLEVVKILPESEPAGHGPCSQAPCNVQALVLQVLGYGAAFHDAISPEQQIMLYFPMTTKAGEGRSGVIEGNKILADVRAPLLEKGSFVIKTYALHP